MRFFPKKLSEGHQRFRASRMAGERVHYQRLAESGQKPDVMIISCCDSRVAPEIVFDASPGEIFVVRNVANLVPPYAPDGKYHGTSAALEYAVQVLKVKHILVLGHGRCGGVKAFLEGLTEPLSPGDFIGKWISLIAPAADRLQQVGFHGTDAQGRMERASILQSLDNLRTFPSIEALVFQGDLTLHGAWFDIATGALEIFDRGTKQFLATLEA
ncbi:MAG: carbonic anhydrase [Hyphomicrobiales bacterium]|nr:carbonic anhydrase [Hyphomicrobiales bacterium]